MVDASISIMEPVEAKVADAQKLTAFFHQAWEEAGPTALGFTGATDETIREIASEGFLEERLSNPKVKMYVVEDKGRIVGFAATRRVDENTIELSGIIVLESATGKGIGTALFEKVVLSAKQRGFGKIVVKTEVFNERATGFYKKMGLAETSRTTEKVEGKPIELMVLEKALR